MKYTTIFLTLILIVSSMGSVFATDVCPRGGERRDSDCKVKWQEL